jgi:hypothetical protein
MTGDDATSGGLRPLPPPSTTATPPDTARPLTTPPTTPPTTPGTTPGTTSIAAAPRQSRIVGILVWAVLLAIPAALVGGGGWLLYQRTSGTRVQATVLDCDLSGGRVGGASTYRQDCTASWTIDGELVVGVFSGGNGESDVGKTVEATVRGDTAYSRSLRLPVVLIALGLPFLALPVIAIRSRLKARSAGVTD